MTEQNKDFRKVICWGCGKALTYEGQSCPWCNEPGIVALPQPKEVMPFCGSNNDYSISKISESTTYGAIANISRLDELTQP